MAIPSAFHGASLELCNLTLAYGPIEVLRNVSLSIEPGTTCIIGPSGSGKSTLLRGINRLHEPKKGDVLLAGRSVLKDKPDSLRLRIGMVFQHFNLFPDHSALENVALAPWKVKGLPKAEALEIARQRLAEVGPLSSRSPSARPLRWPATAGGDSTCAGDGAGSDAVR
jgi:polar amino acid transport system ATP-binding protein